MKKFVFLATIISTLILITAVDGLAQPFRKRPPTAPGDPIDAQSTTDVPIDGGLGVLLALGAGYGIRRLRQEKKKKVVD
jgi:hypothetical protein